MKKLLLVLFSGYLVIAGATKVAERFGLRRCGCSEDCWCHRPGLALFRWVFPWGHTAADPAGDGTDLQAPRL